MNLIERTTRKITWLIDKVRLPLRSNGLAICARNIVGSMYPKRLLKLPGKSQESETYFLEARDSMYPLFCRCDSSDRDVFRSVFEWQEYASLNDLSDVRLIIDCGANVGYTAAYFLTRFPLARVIAIEPDRDNFVVLAENLKPYGDRVTLLQTGVWSHSTGLTLCQGEFGDDGEWVTQVRESLPEERPDVRAVDIGTLLRESGCDKIDILKLDIERSEMEVFARNYEEWLSKTRSMAVELNGQDCEEVFYRAIEGYSFSISHSVEVVICRS